MGKHFIRTSKNVDSALAPYDGIMDDAGLREKFEGLSTEARFKLTAFLYASKTAKQVAEIIGLSKWYVYKAARCCPEIYQAAQMTRQSLVSELAERKTIDMLESIDVTKVDDSKKATAAKHLMETADLANTTVSSRQNREDGTTAELILRIKTKQKLPETKPEAIDITDQVETEVKEEG